MTAIQMVKNIKNRPVSNPPQIDIRIGWEAV
jgi:hypothetical protein